MSVLQQMSLLLFLVTPTLLAQSPKTVFMITDAEGVAGNGRFDCGDGRGARGTRDVTTMNRLRSYFGGSLRERKALFAERELWLGLPAAAFRRCGWKPQPRDFFTASN